MDLLRWGVVGRVQKGSFQDSWKKGVPPPRGGHCLGHRTGVGTHGLGGWCLPTVTFCPGCRAQLTPLGSQVAGTNLCPEGQQWLCGTVHVPTQIKGHCCCSSVTQSCPALCDPIDRSTPGLPVPHQLPEFAQVQVH